MSEQNENDGAQKASSFENTKKIVIEHVENDERLSKGLYFVFEILIPLFKWFKSRGK